MNARGGEVGEGLTAEGNEKEKGKGMIGEMNGRVGEKGRTCGNATAQRERNRVW